MVVNEWYDTGIITEDMIELQGDSQLFFLPKFAPKNLEKETKTEIINLMKWYWLKKYDQELFYLKKTLTLNY